MSSFKRRSTKQTLTPPGTRILLGSTSNLITSTGIPSLDDILGGGLPLSCSQLILAPDVHSAYGELVQKYFVVQGLAAGQAVCVINEGARSFLEGCMWLPGANSLPASINSAGPGREDEEDESSQKHDAKIKIAWRYEQMKQFQTSVSSSTQSADDFCRVFDLTSRLPVSTIDAALSAKQLVIFDVPISDSAMATTRSMLKHISDFLVTYEEEQKEVATPLRICIPGLGSPAWGDIEPQVICYFLYAFRSLLRTHPHVCASISLPPHLCIEKWGGPGWVQKLGWLSDASLSLTAFSANPSLTALFPTYHGFVHIHSLPAPSTLVSPSDKYSMLRGLTSSGENNLAFKCMRKRLIFETLHLDVEGGIGERRMPPAAATVTVGGLAHDHSSHGHGGAASIQVQVEEVQNKVELVSVAEDAAQGKTEAVTTSSFVKKPKHRKKVAFTSDRPDLYDF
ncbi:Elongator complex protein 4 [Irpex rosettiformis]|uniref:Elongator complex protein 4 n=1 Tax=Irpex rosettiformis TaxID=378272 RepID=A0ACB8UK35_9APHY|nr:Elongator complex protein 4 [Irpex rosettiformis]